MTAPARGRLDTIAGLCEIGRGARVPVGPTPRAADGGSRPARRMPPRNGRARPSKRRRRVLEGSSAATDRAVLSPAASGRCCSPAPTGRHLRFAEHLAAANEEAALADLVRFGCTAPREHYRTRRTRAASRRVFVVLVPGDALRAALRAARRRATSRAMRSRTGTCRSPAASTPWSPPASWTRRSATALSREHLPWLMTSRRCWASPRTRTPPISTSRPASRRSSASAARWCASRWRRSRATRPRRPSTTSSPTCRSASSRSGATSTSRSRSRGIAFRDKRPHAAARPAAVFRGGPRGEVARRVGMRSHQGLSKLQKGSCCTDPGSGKATTLGDGRLVNGRITATSHHRGHDRVRARVKKCLQQARGGAAQGSFSAALRAAMSEDPEGDLVGELRDLEKQPRCRPTRRAISCCALNTNSGRDDRPTWTSSDRTAGEIRTALGVR